MPSTALSVNKIDPNKMQLEPLLKIEDAARLVGRTHWTLRHDVRAGRLRCIRIGRRIMFEQSEIRRLIEEGRVGCS